MDAVTRAVVPAASLALTALLGCMDAAMSGGPAPRPPAVRPAARAPAPAPALLAPEDAPAAPLPEIAEERAALPVFLEPPTVQVRLAAARPGKDISFTVHGAYRVFELKGSLEDGALGPLLAAGDGLKRARARAAREGVVMNGELLAGKSLLVCPRNDGALEVDGRRYRGDLALLASPGLELAAVNRVDIEDYVAGVLFGEMPKRFAKEAQRAQAVAVRTYALYHVLNGRVLSDDQGSQVYRGTELESDAARRIADSTVGEVLTHADRLVQAYFHSTCGGATGSAAEVFCVPAAGQVLAGAACPSCRDSPHFAWTRGVPPGVIAGLYNGAFGQALTFDVASRDPAGRALEVAVLDAAGRQVDRLPADRFRNRYNAGRPLAEQIPSAMIDEVRRAGLELRIKGRGFGHGVGLCQYGANGMAHAGGSYQDILGRYYPGAQIRRLYD
ncbi:MAG: SpoIID/LytB domain-containing protein [Planctomycetes bacterium]|nr:SpoIID/LytB domain-containing protein [Planctomycetota bacterium]